LVSYFDALRINPSCYLARGGRESPNSRDKQANEVVSFKSDEINGRSIGGAEFQMVIGQMTRDIAVSIPELEKLHGRLMDER
jgi:hypothetical protein